MPKTRITISGQTESELVKVQSAESRPSDRDVEEDYAIDPAASQEVAYNKSEDEGDEESESAGWRCNLLSKPKVKRRLFCQLPAILLVFAAGGLAGYGAAYARGVGKDGGDGGGVSASNQQLAALPETTEETDAAANATTDATLATFGTISDPPTDAPTDPPTPAPTDTPTDPPTDVPTYLPTYFPTYLPTPAPVEATVEAEAQKSDDVLADPAAAAGILEKTIADLEAFPEGAGAHEAKEVAIEGVQGAMDALLGHTAKEDEEGDGAPLEVTEMVLDEDEETRRILRERSGGAALRRHGDRR
ncbi:hypothetical protein ACHAWF_004693 [Thalassiosira exigua]